MNAPHLSALRLLLFAAFLIVPLVPVEAEDRSAAWLEGGDQAVANFLGRPLASQQSAKQRDYRYTLYSNPKNGLIEGIALYRKDKCVGIIFIRTGKLRDVDVARELEANRGDSSWGLLEENTQRGKTPEGIETEVSIRSWRRKDKQLYSMNLWFRQGRDEMTLFLLGNKRAAKVTTKIAEEMVQFFAAEVLKMQARKKR